MGNICGPLAEKEYSEQTKEMKIGMNEAGKETNNDINGT